MLSVIDVEDIFSISDLVQVAISQQDASVEQVSFFISPRHQILE